MGGCNHGFVCRFHVPENFILKVVIYSLMRVTLRGECVIQVSDWFYKAARVSCIHVRVALIVSRDGFPLASRSSRRRDF